MSRTLIILITCLGPFFLFGQSYTYSHPIDFQPEEYVCYQTNAAITIDGKDSEEDWTLASWSSPFVDIEGSLKPNPYLETKCKMLWDSTYFYFYFELEEPHIWATLTERDDIIFLDDDIEIFIDPDADVHSYYEFEINAFNTLWDLLLIRPYRLYRAPQAVYEYNVLDLNSAVHIEGSLNDPKDEDKFWSVEVAIPWRALAELAPRIRGPKDGEQWRVNFSRVDWDMEIKDNSYQKKLNPETNHPVSEHNWVWSPMGKINMHMPEVWGFVQFAETAVGQAKTSFNPNPNEEIKWAMWNLYWQQMEYYTKHDSFTSDLSLFSIPTLSQTLSPKMSFEPKIYTTPNYFEIEAASSDGNSKWILEKEGRMYNTKKLVLNKLK